MVGLQRGGLRTETLEGLRDVGSFDALEIYRGSEEIAVGIHGREVTGIHSRDDTVGHGGDDAVDCRHYVLTADFNTQDFSEFGVLAAPLMINRKGSRHVTFPGGSSAIDNIILSDCFTEISAGTIVSDASDHYILFAETVFEN